MRGSRWFALTLSSCFVGCAGDDTNFTSSTLDGGAADATAALDANAIPDVGDARQVDEVAPAQLQVAAVRVANWSLDAAAIDVCLAPHGTGTFAAPLLASLARATIEAGVYEDASAAALSFPEVSAYSYVPPGLYDARAVAAGSSDCRSGISADMTTLPMFDVGTFVTIALVGEAHPTGDAPALHLAGFLDDQKPRGLVGVRFIHAAPSLGAVDFGIGTIAGGFKPLFVDVAFGQTGSSPDASASADSNGYESVQPLVTTVLTAHVVDGVADTAIAPDVSAATGSVLTIVLLDATPAASVSDAGSATAGLLQCVDNAGNAGSLSGCGLISK